MRNGQGSENMPSSNSSDIYNINNINSKNIHSQYLNQGLQTQEPSKKENSFPQSNSQEELKYIFNINENKNLPDIQEDKK